MSIATKIKRGLDKGAQLYRANDSIQRAVNIDLGGGKTFKIEPGSLLRASDEYEGQLGGKVVLVQPYGSKDGAGQQGSSTFTLTVKQLEDNFTKIDPNTEDAQRTARDDRQSKNYSETSGVPGRRTSAEVEGKSEEDVKKPKKDTMKENYVGLVVDQDIVNFKQTIADRLDMLAHQAIENEKYGSLQDTGDQTDQNNTEDSDQIEEIVQHDQQMVDQLDELMQQIQSMDDDQLNEYIENLDDDQLNLFEQLIDSIE